MKYIKKPIPIEAHQYNGEPVKGMCSSRIGCPVFKPHVHTIHNNQAVLIEEGDWILPEADGIHYYPCKPDIFEETYTEAGEKSENLDDVSNTLRELFQCMRGDDIIALHQPGPTYDVLLRAKRILANAPESRTFREDNK